MKTGRGLRVVSIPFMHTDRVERPLHRDGELSIQSCDRPAHPRSAQGITVTNVTTTRRSWDTL